MHQEPKEPRERLATQGEMAPRKSRWTTPLIEELPSLGELALGSPVGGGGNLHDPIF